MTNGSSYTIGDTVPTKPGGTIGPEQHGMDTVLSWDPVATYDIATQSVQNTCATTSSCTCGGTGCPNGSSISPRIVVVALCSPSEADCAAGGASNGQITITNLLSFFLLGYTNDHGNLDIEAEIIGGAGLLNAGGGPAPSAFLHVIRLVR